MVNDRFVVESRLDEGPLGSVYQAIDRHEPEDSTSRRVALWLLPDELTQNKSALAAFVRGFDALRALRHDSIVRIYDYGQVGDRHFVTSELVDGETLRNVVDHLRPDRLGYDEVDEVLVEIGDALSYLHDQGLVHGDVRADNVLVTVDQRFKLVNLAASSLVSTAVSASPRADTRDFAAMAYELYGGRPIPWDGKLRRLRSLGKPRWRSIERALSNDAQYRQMTMQDFLEQSGLTLRPSLGRIAAPRIRARRSARGIWKLPAVAGIAVAAVVVYSDGRIESVVTSMQQRLGGLVATLDDDAAPQRDAGEVPSIAVEPPPVAGRAVAGNSRQPGALAAAGRPEVPRDPAQPAPETTESLEQPRAVSLDDDYGAQAQVAAQSPAAAAPVESVDSVESAEGAAVVSSELTARSAAALSRISLSSSVVVARESLGGLSIDVLRDGAIDTAVEFVWWTTEDTALEGDDYASFGRRIERLAPGESKVTLYVPLTSDALPEPDERFFIHLAADSPGLVLGDVSTAQVTLIDDDR